MIAGVQLVQTLGSLVNARIYPMIIREHDDATAPYIIYQTISSVSVSIHAPVMDANGLLNQSS